MVIYNCQEEKKDVSEMTTITQTMDVEIAEEDISLLTNLKVYAIISYKLKQESKKKGIYYYD